MFWAGELKIIVRLKTNGIITSAVLAVIFEEDLAD